MDILFYSILIMLPFILFAALFTAIVLHLEKKIDESNRR